jgi:hypothetical protein
MIKKMIENEGNGKVRKKGSRGLRRELSGLGEKWGK